jgi:hypothetical protein
MSTTGMEHRIDPLTETAPTPAPYGHACSNCAHSKCRCILYRIGGPCERCRRLNKECRPAETVRRRNPRKVTASKTARLEEKLDGLVSLIKAGQSGKDITSSSFNDIHNVPVLTPPMEDATTSSYPSSVFQDVNAEPSLTEAEECLLCFKRYHSQYFPFVYIPSTTTAQELRQDKPFLWLCIMAVSSKSTARQQVLSTKIRQTVAQEMLFQAEKNIDLLLGLLTFIGWYDSCDLPNSISVLTLHFRGHFQFYAKPFLAAFTQLAMSLVFDLGLNKPVLKDMHPVPCLKDKTCSRPSGPRTMDERRAVLGCFLITSMYVSDVNIPSHILMIYSISSFLQKIDALQWTPHMDECLKIIDEAKECPNDNSLVKLVQLQLVTEISMLDTLHEGVARSFKHMEDPTPLNLEALNPQLQEYKTKLLAQPQIDSE